MELRDIRRNIPVRGPGMVVGPELRALSEKPGYLSWEEGGQRMRDLYVDGSAAFEPSLLSDFGLACFLGLHDLVKQMVESGSAPDICGHETAYRHGYLTLVVSGRQRLTKSPLPSEHAETARLLIDSGAPIDLDDIANYTALQHATIRDGPQLDVARVLLEKGADPNHRNKYGCTSLLEACMTGAIKSLDLLLEFGADPEVTDADGCKPSTFHLQAGPAVSAVFMKWQRIRSGARPAARQEKRCDACGNQPGNGTALRLCSRCRTTQYCNTECQRQHWPTHKASCRRFNSSTALTMVPHYVTFGDIQSTSAIIRQTLGERQATKTKQSSSGGAWPATRDLPKQLIIKVQVPFAGFGASPAAQAAAERLGDCLAYTKKRDLVCQLRRQENPDTYDALILAIKEKGAGGLKAYFTAEMRSKDELIIKTDEVLAEQSF